MLIPFIPLLDDPYTCFASFMYSADAVQLDLNTGYADNDADICIKFNNLCPCTVCFIA